MQTMLGKNPLHSACQSNRGGYAATVSVLILSSVLSVVLLQIAFSTWSYLDRGQIRRDGLHMRLYAEACMQEGLMALSRDDTFTNMVVSLDDVGDIDCAVDVIDEVTWRTVSTTVTWEDYVYPLRARVEPTAMRLMSWGE